jgi:hypothetical protein
MADERESTYNRNPYDLVDYDGKRQEEPCLNYGDFLSDMLPLIQEFRHDSGKDFLNLYRTSKKCLWVFDGNHDSVEEIAASLIEEFAADKPLDYWSGVPQKSKVVLGAMMALRIVSDETVNFGEIDVRRFVGEKELDSILADKYLEFYGKMIADKTKKHPEPLEDSRDYFTSAESTIDRLAEIVSRKGESYQRPKIWSGGFKEMFGISTDTLRKRSEVRGWNLKISEMLSLAEKQAANGKQAYTEEFVQF